MASNINNMSCLDIYTFNNKNLLLKKFQKDIETAKFKVMPLMSWDIFMTDYHGRIAQTLKRIELDQVLTFARKFKWKNDLVKAFEDNDYEALVITDKNQNIIWVNNGFTEMTGYSKTFAIHKTPRFLQGEKTSKKTKNTIRQNIAKDKPFKEIIFNYKKDGTPYKCEVRIIPLYNDQTTHYIAFEKQVV
ncbi:PAS domain-containing protein [Winogradskyella sp.]|uniref:PAS domain-containing protein n=1 Tax=Winogradskyella sp. TaxID=1883156 RepID=UPI002631D4DD|nr:PAS domain-containing protein [Winogradskyella sp.]